MWKQDFDAVNLATQEDVGQFQGSSWKVSGTLRTAGQSYIFRNSMWRSRVSVLNAAGETVFDLKGVDWWGQKYEVVLAPGVPFDPTVELLMYMAWYAMKRQADDANGAVASIT